MISGKCPRCKRRIQVSEEVKGCPVCKMPITAQDVNRSLYQPHQRYPKR